MKNNGTKVGYSSKYPCKGLDVLLERTDLSFADRNMRLKCFKNVYDKDVIDEIVNLKKKRKKKKISKGYIQNVVPKVGLWDDFLDDYENLVRFVDFPVSSTSRSSGYWRKSADKASLAPRRKLLGKYASLFEPRSRQNKNASTSVLPLQSVILKNKFGIQVPVTDACEQSLESRSELGGGTNYDSTKEDSAIVEHESVQVKSMMDSCSDQDDLGTDKRNALSQKEDICKQRVQNEYDKLKRRNKDRRTTDQRNLWAESREKFAIKTKEFFAKMEKMKEENNQEVNVKNDTIDAVRQIKLEDRHDAFLKENDRPLSELGEGIGLLSKEAFEVRSDSGLSGMSENSVMFKERDDEVTFHIKERDTKPDKERRGAPPDNKNDEKSDASPDNNIDDEKRDATPDKKSPFVSPLTPKQYKKRSVKVCYLKANGDQKRFDTFKKYDKNQYFSQVKSIMPEKRRLPTMISFSPITRNKLFDPEALMPNIPYFGDEALNGKFIANCESQYNVGFAYYKEIAESKVKQLKKDNEFKELFDTLLKFKDIFDEDFHALLKSKALDSAPDCIFRLPETTIEKKFVEKHETRRHLLYYFRAYSNVFSSNASTDTLITKYESLNAAPERCSYFPNIDGVDDIGALSVDFVNVLHSYKDLMCRRCYNYDCTLHEDDPRAGVRAPYFLTEDQLFPFKLETEVCGSDCYLLIADLNAHNAMSPRTPSYPNKVKNYDSKYKPLDWNPTDDDDENVVSKEGEWSVYEELFCKNLLTSYQSGYCAVGRLMITKTCRQVFEKFTNNLETKKKRKDKKLAKGTKKKPKKRIDIKKKKNKLQVFKSYSRAVNIDKVENEHNYSPCYHPCEDCSEETEGCFCMKGGNFCDKFCYCPKDCKNRFPGCQCRSICTTKHCSCYLASRECDPDLCGMCRADELDYYPDPEKPTCRNIALQKKMGKKLLVSESDIPGAGWGCFIGEKAKKFELIAEYLGEIITPEEADRRGQIYDQSKCTYIFTLNNEYLLDAARYGAKIRFANHSDTPNCIVKTVRVQGDYRIGLYAARDIDVGEELFFDYGEKFQGHDLREIKKRTKKEV